MEQMLGGRVVVTGGVDTHRDTHTVAALDQLGRVLETASFPATRSGFEQLLGWLGGHGQIRAVGVEGTGSWGAGLAWFLTEAGVEVIEVLRPNRQHRRRYGKSDPADAIAAAKAVLSGEAAGEIRHRDGSTVSLRMLRIARNSAVKSRTMIANQIQAICVTGPTDLRERFAGRPLGSIVPEAARLRPGDDLSDPVEATKIALQSLARRYRGLTDEINRLTGAISQLTNKLAPTELLAECGIGPINASDLLITYGSNPGRISTETSFAALCGVSPVDASSGRQIRHRLNRGGDRAANAALHRAVICRLRYHQPTRDYMTRRLTEGKTRPEIIRCLKRALARRIYRTLQTPQPAT